jgi:hypothetical protein
MVPNEDILKCFVGESSRTFHRNELRSRNGQNGVSHRFSPSHFVPHLGLRSIYARFATASLSFRMWLLLPDTIGQASLLLLPPASLSFHISLLRPTRLPLARRPSSAANHRTRRPRSEAVVQHFTIPPAVVKEDSSHDRQQPTRSPPLDVD